jgi:hypothetical protein
MFRGSRSRHMLKGIPGTRSGRAQGRASTARRLLAACHGPLEITRAQMSVSYFFFFRQTALNPNDRHTDKTTDAQNIPTCPYIRNTHTQHPDTHTPTHTQNMHPYITHTLQTLARAHAHTHTHPYHIRRASSDKKKRSECT